MKILEVLQCVLTNNKKRKIRHFDSTYKYTEQNIMLTLRYIYIHFFSL